MTYFPNLACVGLLLLASSTVNAGFVVDMKQIGSDVVATGSGTLNLSALPVSIGSFPFSGASVVPSSGQLRVGTSVTTNSTAYLTTIFTGPPAFGTGTAAVNANLNFGDPVGIVNGGAILLVPQGYVSNTSLSSSSTWQNQSLSSLGITPGSYKWSWGSGANADSFTLNASITAVPEPSSIALVCLGLAGAIASRRVIKRGVQ